MATETAKMIAGDVGGGGGNTDGDSHGGDGCRFLGVANLIEVRKADRPIKDIFRCTCTEYYLYK